MCATPGSSFIFHPFVKHELYTARIIGVQPIMNAWGMTYATPSDPGRAVFDVFGASPQRPDLSCRYRGDFVFVSGLPPFDPASGQVTRRPFEQQADIVLDQMKRCVEAAGSSMEQVVKCNVYCTDASCFGKFNEIYARYFPKESPARIFLCVPCFPGPFDIEIDCIAVV